MTSVSDFMRWHKEAKDSVDKSRKIADDLKLMCGVVLHDKTDAEKKNGIVITKEQETEFRDAYNRAITAMNDMYGVCLHYSNLMEEMSNSIEVAWPPSGRFKKD